MFVWDSWSFKSVLVCSEVTKIGSLRLEKGIKLVWDNGVRFIINSRRNTTDERIKTYYEVFRGHSDVRLASTLLNYGVKHYRGLWRGGFLSNALQHQGGITTVIRRKIPAEPISRSLLQWLIFRPFYSQVTSTYCNLSAHCIDISMSHITTCVALFPENRREIGVEYKPTRTQTYKVNTT